MPIDRTPMSDQVYRELVDRILSGAYPSGSRVSDRELSGVLDASRTPIREALRRLERDGLLLHAPHRGFFVRELTVTEVRQVYPVIGILETGLLEVGMRSNPPPIERLEELNQRLERTADPVERVELDMAWHEALTGTAENPYADGILSAAKNIVRRYEYAYMREAGHIPLSVSMHEEIRCAIAGGDLEAGGRLLEEHWEFGMLAVERWLDRVGLGRLGAAGVHRR